jgi:hypothetical protein
VLPNRIANWSLTSLQQRLVKTGGRLVRHARYFWLLLAEGLQFITGVEISLCGLLVALMPEWESRESGGANEAAAVRHPVDFASQEQNTVVLNLVPDLLS